LRQQVAASRWDWFRRGFTISVSLFQNLVPSIGIGIRSWFVVAAPLVVELPSALLLRFAWCLELLVLLWF
jgi:hypothetical protein